MLNEQRIQSLVLLAAQSFGRSFDGVSFHAFDENQMPISGVLNAEQYATWLTHTYEHLPIEQLRSIATQYDGAIASAKTSTGILPDALANLIVSGAVFHALIEERPTPQQQSPIPEAAVTPPSETTTPEQHAQKTSNEDRELLEQMRDGIIRELRIDAAHTTHAHIESRIRELVAQREKELQLQPHLSPSMKEQELKKYRSHLNQKSIALQSINARLGEPLQSTEPTVTAPPITTPEHVTNLLAEEQRILTEVTKLYATIDSTPDASPQLKRVRTQLHIVQELLQNIVDDNQS